MTSPALTKDIEAPPPAPCSTTGAPRSRPGLGTGLTHFPGGHNGNITHPEGFAGMLRQVL